MSISSVFFHRTFNLLHPDLQSKDRSWLVRRSDFFSRWWFPADEQVGWFGGAVRPDGGQGLYMTNAQAREWKTWVAQNDIKAGPV